MDKKQERFNVVQLDLSSLHPREGKYDQLWLILKMIYRVMLWAFTQDRDCLFIPALSLSTTLYPFESVAPESAAS